MIRIMTANHHKYLCKEIPLSDDRTTVHSDEDGYNDE